MVVVTSGFPLQTGGTVIVASNQTVTNAAYPPGPAMPAAYSQAPPPAYDVNQPPAYAGGVDKIAMWTSDVYCSIVHVWLNISYFSD